MKEPYLLLEKIWEGRMNASKNYISYLRGRAYILEKERHPINRTQEHNLKVVDLLAQQFKVGTTTIMRDYRFAIGLDRFKGELISERELILKNESILKKSEVTFLGKFEFLNVKDFFCFIKKGGNLKDFDGVDLDDWGDLLKRTKKKKKGKDIVKERQPKVYTRWFQQEERLIEIITNQGTEKDKEEIRKELRDRIKEIEELIEKVK